MRLLPQKHNPARPAGLRSPPRASAAFSPAGRMKACPQLAQRSPRGGAAQGAVPTSCSTTAWRGACCSATRPALRLAARIRQRRRSRPCERDPPNALIASGGDLGHPQRSSSGLARRARGLVRRATLVPRRHLGLGPEAAEEPTRLGGRRLPARRGRGARRRSRRLPRRAVADRVGRSGAVLRACAATSCGEGRGPGARRREHRGDCCPRPETAGSGGARIGRRGGTPSERIARLLRHMPVRAAAVKGDFRRACVAAQRPSTLGR